jgi:GTPase SAR1 family protein
MQIVKIVITGGYAAGKTRFIRTISDIEPVSTDYAVTTEEERALKHETTVALDFGVIAINERLSLYLFGTPGQERFDFMWEHLAFGALGYVVMVEIDSRRSLMCRLWWRQTNRMTRLRCHPHMFVVVWVFRQRCRCCRAWQVIAAASNGCC